MHPELKIAMDMSIQLKVAVRRDLTLSLSFNNNGPFGSFFRYICDNGTYIARYDDLLDGKDKQIDLSKVDVSMNGIELEDREFFAAIKEGREPNASARAMPAGDAHAGPDRAGVLESSYPFSPRAGRSPKGDEGPVRTRAISPLRPSPSP